MVERSQGGHMEPDLAHIRDGRDKQAKDVAARCNIGAPPLAADGMAVAGQALDKTARPAAQTMVDRKGLEPARKAVAADRVALAGNKPAEAGQNAVEEIVAPVRICAEPVPDQRNQIGIRHVHAGMVRSAHRFETAEILQWSLLADHFHISSQYPLPARHLWNFLRDFPAHLSIHHRSRTVSASRFRNHHYEPKNASCSTR